MEAKRNISELENLPQNTGRKVLFTTNYQCENILLPYYHHTSPLLTPKDDLILDFERVFVMRTIRLFKTIIKLLCIFSTRISCFIT